MVIIVTSIYRVELKISIFILYIHFKFTYYLCLLALSFGLVLKRLRQRSIIELYRHKFNYFILFLLVFLVLQLSRTLHKL